MTRNVPIRSIGLDTYLEATKEKHNGLGAREYHIMRDAHVSAAAMCRAFGVVKVTMEKWNTIDEEEQKGQE